MASCSDLNRSECPPITKATPVPISASKKLVEPFNRLRNRANLFRRKNYSSQLNISSHSTNHRSSSGADHIVPSHHPPTTNFDNTGVTLLKRSNSMVCSQQRFPTYLNQNNNNNNHHRNSLCLELAGCSTDESSTDDYPPRKLSSNCYWSKPICSTMSDINEHEILSTTQSSIVMEETDEEEKVSSLPNNNNNSEQASVIFPSSQSTMDVISSVQEDEQAKQREQLTSPATIPTSIISSSHSSSSSSSTVILRDHAETIRTRRQCHSSISLLQHQQRQQSLSSSFEEPFYDCKPAASPKKCTPNPEMSLVKVSACTMTGRSLNNLDECSTSSEEKGVQTTLNDLINTNACVKRAISSTSLSSSSTSMQTDSLEKKPKIPISTVDETTCTNEIQAPTLLPITHQMHPHYNWPHVHQRLLGEHACIYWVNYLGSTAIKMSADGTTTMPSQAIARLKQSTQYARLLPIIGLSISSRGVEFLKHTKDRVVICFHDIKSIHCACQDQDLRYFAYVTREQRLTNGMPHGSTTASTNSSLNQKQQAPPSPTLSIGSDYHQYCHVFVVKSEAMSTEIMLTFGQVFDLAYRLHRRVKSNGKKSKDMHAALSSMMNGDRHPQLEVIRLSTKSDITHHHHNNGIMSSSTHSPATSSSSSSTDERKVFV